MKNYSVYISNISGPLVIKECKSYLLMSTSEVRTIREQIAMSTKIATLRNITTESEYLKARKGDKRRDSLEL